VEDSLTDRLKMLYTIIATLITLKMARSPHFCGIVFGYLLITHRTCVEKLLRSRFQRGHRQ